MPELYDWQTEPGGRDWATIAVGFAVSAVLGVVMFLTVTGGV